MLHMLYRLCYCESCKKLCNIWKYIQSSACYRNTANRFFTLLSLQSLSSLLSVICMQLPRREMTHSQRVSYDALLAPMAICAANKVLCSPYPWQNHVFNGQIINFTLFPKKKSQLSKELAFSFSLTMHLPACLQPDQAGGRVFPWRQTNLRWQTTFNQGFLPITHTSSIFDLPKSSAYARPHENMWAPTHLWGMGASPKPHLHRCCFTVVRWLVISKWQLETLLAAPHSGWLHTHSTRCSISAASSKPEAPSPGS